MIQEAYIINDETKIILTVTQLLPHAQYDVILSVQNINTYLTKETAEELIKIIHKVLDSKFVLTEISKIK